MTRRPGHITRWRIRRKVARQLADAMQQGRTLIAVPSEFAAEVLAWVYARRIERASEKWARRAAEVPLWAWQASMIEKGELRWGSDQAGTGSDEHTGGP